MSLESSLFYRLSGSLRILLKIPSCQSGAPPIKEGFTPKNRYSKFDRILESLSASNCGSRISNALKIRLCRIFMVGAVGFDPTTSTLYG